MAIMRKIIAFYEGYVSGTDACHAFVFPDDYTDNQISDDLYNWACYIHDSWNFEDEDSFYDEGPQYYFEDYDPVKHDCQRAGGGSFEKDFERELLRS